MFARITSAPGSARLPQLAATAMLCWSLSATNAHFDMTSPQGRYASGQAQGFPAPAVSDPASVLVVLSGRDADIYRAAFAAQEKGDWAEADRLMAKLDNRDLIGHLLADRYGRRPATSAELRQWLESYADLPEAGDIYDQASRAEGESMPKPAASVWSGGEGYDAASAFSADYSGPSAAGRRFVNRIGALVRRNDFSKAEQLLDTETRKRVVAGDEFAAAQSLIAAGFYMNGDTSHARALTEAIDAQQNPLGLWIEGLAAWKEKDSEAAGAAFAKLAAQTSLPARDRAAASFWAYRALDRSHQPDEARYWLRQAAQEPHSFYGMLAAQLAGHTVNRSWNVPELDEDYIAAIKSEKPGWRALALLQIGRRDLAEAELRDLNPQGRRDLQDAMLALAESEHMPSLALQLGGMATKADGQPYDAALYPLPPWQPSGGFAVDRALLFALMKHESQFDPSAVSGRGACGLMQLMPATAHSMTHKISARDCSDRLMDPAVNIALGQDYVLHLANQPVIGNNLLLLLAAYNGGPTKLARWLHDGGESDPLLFLESMPVRQTHDYVEQVLMHYWMYRARLGEPEMALRQLAHGEWPRYALKEEAHKTRNAQAPDTRTPSALELARQ